MRRAIALVLLSVGSLTTIGFSSMTDSSTLRDCVNGVCAMRMTAPQLLAETEALVLARRFDEARPMLAALSEAPELSMERHFLEGYVAAETGDLPVAAKEFRAVLRERPDMTRARLELARVLMLQGKDSAADHHFRLAQEAADLPPEIERTIRTQRGIIRDRRNWHLNIDVGLAPDSNINNATDSRTATFGGYNPFNLNDDARRKSGVGQTATVSAGVRLRLSDGLAMVVDADGQVVNQKGKSADDISALLAAGPELTMKGGAKAAVQVVGAQRWYGGRSARTGGGVRLTYQQTLDAGQRIGFQVDAQKFSSGFGRAFDGWTLAGYATYERVVNRSMIASATLYARREDLRSPIYSTTEYGGNIGIGGELPHGLNAGLSAGIARILFDEPLIGTIDHHDWRFNARAYLGARSIRVLGFSPSVTYTYNRNASTIDLYRTDRHRVTFGLARYF